MLSYKDTVPEEIYEKNKFMLDKLDESKNLMDNLFSEETLNEELIEKDIVATILNMIADKYNTDIAVAYTYWDRFRNEELINVK